jgi:hypothetical protein
MYCMFPDSAACFSVATQEHKDSTCSFRRSIHIRGVPNDIRCASLDSHPTTLLFAERLLHNVKCGAAALFFQLCVFQRYGGVEIARWGIRLHPAFSCAFHLFFLPLIPLQKDEP